MTRDEQIKKAEIKYSNNTLFDGCDFIGQVAKQEAFIAGAKWADETMIDKACKWLEYYVEMYIDNYNGTIDISSMVEDFQEAMKE